MIDIAKLREYLNMPPDMPDTIAEMCLSAAKSKTRAAGIPDYKNNAEYDLFLCALAGLWYDNRGMRFVGDTGNASVAASAQNMINGFVLELRFAGEDVQEVKPDG